MSLSTFQLVTARLLLICNCIRSGSDSVRLTPVTNRIPNSNVDRHYLVVETDSNKSSNYNNAQKIINCVRLVRVEPDYFFIFVRYFIRTKKKKMTIQKSHYRPNTHFRLVVKNSFFFRTAFAI